MRPMAAPERPLLISGFRKILHGGDGHKVLLATPSGDKPAWM